MNMKAFRKARPFYEVIPSFLEWCGPMEDAVFCSWGSSGSSRASAEHALLPYKKSISRFPLYYLDIQKIFSLQREDGRSRKNLQSVVDALELPKDQPFHEALGDASLHGRNPADAGSEEQALEVLLPWTTTALPRTGRKSIQIRYETYQKFVSKPFRTKTDAMRDRKVAATRCYICGKPARKKIRWFTGNSKNYYCLARCEEHGWLKGKNRMKKTEDNGDFFCVKTLKLVSDAEAETHHTEERSPETKTETLQKRGMSLCPQRFFTFV